MSITSHFFVLALLGAAATAGAQQTANPSVHSTSRETDAQVKQTATRQPEKPSALEGFLDWLKENADEPRENDKYWSQNRRGGEGGGGGSGGDGGGGGGHN